MEQLITLKNLQGALPNIGNIPPCVNDNMSNPQQIYGWCMRIYYALTACHNNINVFNSDTKLFNNIELIGIRLEDDDNLANAHKAIHAATLIALMYPIKTHSNEIQQFRLLYNMNTHCNQTYQPHKLTSLCLMLPLTNVVKSRYHKLHIDIVKPHYQELFNDKTIIPGDMVNFDATISFNDRSSRKCKFTP